MNINEIFDYLATTDLDGYILVEDLREADWEVYQDELMWVVDGETYSADIRQGEVVNIDDLIFINAENGSGDTLTYVVSKDNQMMEIGEYD